MKLKAVLYVLCMIALIVGSILVFAPGPTRATGGQQKPSRVTTPERERADKPDSDADRRGGNAPATADRDRAKGKPGVAKRVSNFVKGLFSLGKPAALKDDDEDEQEVRVVKMTPRSANVTSGPISYRAEAFGITPPIRDMPQVKLGAKPTFDPSKAHIEDVEHNEIEVDRSVPGNYDHKDALADKSRELAARAAANPNAPLAMPGPALSFDGNLSSDIFALIGTTSMPPDTVGDVGPNHYVQLTNVGVFRIFNKTGTPLTSIARISTLFAGLPATNKCRLRDNGDPIVNYDPLADRWVFSQFALTDASGDSNPPYYQCIAVSQTSDPTGAYYAYAFQGPNTNFPDYPHYGVWTDGYYLSTHEFNAYGTAYVQGGFWAFNRAKMLVGDPSANLIYFSRSATFGQMPVDIDGYMPPAAGTPEMFYEFDADEFGGTDSLLPYEFVPDFNVPANSTFTALAPIPLAAYDPLDPSGRTDMEQPAPALATHNLDAVASRNMFRIAYRNLGTIASPTNSYVTSFTVNVSGVNPVSAATYQAAIRWAELRRSGAGAMTVFDQGTHAPDPVSGTGPNRWMGAIAQDNTGNLALGFTRSGTGAGGVAEVNNPSIYWAGRSGGQVAAGTMNEGETLVMQSTGIQAITNSRWGDYSNMAVDPTDDCTFWYTQEYRDSANNSTVSPAPFFWSTRIANFKFPACTPQPKGTLAVTVTSCATGTPINGAAVSADPGSFFRTTAGAGTASIIAAPGAFTVTATRGGQSASNAGVVVNGVTTPVAICLGGPIMAPGAAAITVESCSPASGTVDRGESVAVNLPVQNTFGATTTNLVGTLLLNGGVVAASSPQTYGAIAEGVTVSRSFGFAVDPAQLYGKPVVLSLQLQDGASNLGTVTYTMPASSTAGSAQNVDYSGAAVAVPDNNATGATATVNVSGVNGVIQDLNFQFTGTAATTGNSGLDHARIGNVAVQLISPSGTAVTIVSRPGNPTAANGCTQANFFNTILDDSAAGLLETNCTAGMTGTFRPSNALANFNNENPNGTWTIRVSDLQAANTGTIRNFRLIITPFTGCVSGPTAAGSVVSGRITDPNGMAVSGATINLSGAQNRITITDANGSYQFANVTAGGFYTVTPSLTNYQFSPATRSFSQIGNHTDAGFTAERDAVGSGNAIDSAGFFVRQHYLDFLGREPDEAGFNFWNDQILSCGTDADCRERRTINVSAAYFLSIEFQQTGGMVDGLYRASYGRAPRYAEFVPDQATVARNVIVGSTDWTETLNANKQAFVAAWMERPEFRAAYDGLNNGAYVDALLGHAAGFSGDRAALVNGLNSGVLSRAGVLQEIVENTGFVAGKRNEVFVMMQYFGYLRRDPDASGYQFWLNKLNQFNGNFEQAEMVKAFIVSGEYRDRFR